MFCGVFLADQGIIQDFTLLMVVKSKNATKHAVLDMLKQNGHYVWNQLPKMNKYLILFSTWCSVCVPCPAAV